MKKLASLVGLMMLSTAACAAPVDEDDTESSEDELRTLSVQSCRSPSVTNAPQRSAAGTPIEGTARTTVEGCVLGGSNESGKDVVDRVAAMFKDASTVGNMRALDGKKVFKSFSARASSGTLASGITQEADVTLNADYTPSTRLRVVRKQAADGTYTIDLVNVTPVKARVAFLSLTAVEPGNLKFTVKVKPQNNGVTVSGVAAVKLEQNKDQAEGTAGVVKDMFDWLSKELKAGAPR